MHFYARPLVLSRFFSHEPFRPEAIDARRSISLLPTPSIIASRSLARSLLPTAVARGVAAPGHRRGGTKPKNVTAEDDENASRIARRRLPIGRITK